MIKRHERNASLLFKEWASNFSEGLFVMLRAYADESETEATSICGFVQTPAYWLQFSKKWKRILDDYEAPYFHFREFVTKELYMKPGNAYHGWSESKRDGFLLDLAQLAGEEAIPIGGNYAHRAGVEQTPEAIWEKSLAKLFEDLNYVISEVWTNYTGKILFVYDKGVSKKKCWPFIKFMAFFLKRINVTVASHLRMIKTQCICHYRPQIYVPT